MNSEKQAVYDFWNTASCGEALYLKETSRAGFDAQANKRYELEPYILDFAQFDLYQGKKVLEVGVGLGAEHQRFAESGALLSGIDLTQRAIEFTKNRFRTFELQSDLRVGDAEGLPYGDNSFDLVFSWGVLHHSPNTKKAISEVYRVLKRGGEAKIMVYHKHSFVGYMLWLRYALLKGRIFMPLTDIYSKYLESPGTKAYSVREARNLFGQFSKVSITTILGHGDLLSSNAGQRHEGLALKLARIFWPRRLIKTFFKRHGLAMMIKAQK